MAGIQAVTFTSNPSSGTSAISSKKDKKENVQNAATVAGGTGYAVKAASKRYIQQGMSNKTIVEGEKNLQKMLSATQKVMNDTGRAVKESKGFISYFKRNYKMYTQDAINYLSKWKESKFLGPIVKSPVVKAGASAFGGVLAVFVLISGINRAAENGELAICDLRNKIHSMTNN